MENFEQAKNSYSKWGAENKVRQLEEKVSHHFPVLENGQQNATNKQLLPPLGNPQNNVGSVLLEMLQTQELGSLMRLLLSTLAEKTGAARCFYLRKYQQQWVMFAEWQNGQLVMEQKSPFNPSKKLLGEIIGYVIRNQKKVVYEKGSSTLSSVSYTHLTLPTKEGV